MVSGPCLRSALDKLASDAATGCVVKCCLVVRIALPFLPCKTGLFACCVFLVIHLAAEPGSLHDWNGANGHQTTCATLPKPAEWLSIKTLTKR